MAPHQTAINDTSQIIERTAREHLSRLVETWAEIGLDDEAVRLRFTQCQAHVNALFVEMEKEDEELKQKLNTKVTNLLNQLAIFNRDLDRNESVEINGLALIPARNKLDSSLKELKLLHIQRKAQREKLETEEQELCTVMGRTAEERPLEKALSDPVMHELQMRVSKLKEDQSRLLAEFRNIRKNIIDLYNDLEEQPLSAFQLSITDPNTQNFPLDPDSLGKVAELHDDLQMRVQQIIDETEQLRLRLASLWDRLEVDTETRQSFLENHPGTSKSTRNELREEIARCEELKKQNMEKFTLRMRDELIDLWDKCHVSAEERDAFAPMKSLDFTEDLLERHEAEVRRYELFLEENRDIFNLLSRRAELWDRMTQLEVAATDSNRLNNRGGQLLKEEKERKQIQKELPKVEEKIKQLIHAREEVNGEPFCLNGRRASLVLNEQWDAKRQQKEAEKQNKKIAQQKQLERDAIMGTTMMAGQKRKLVPSTPDMGRKLPRITPAKAPAPAAASRAATTAGKTGKFVRPATRPMQRKLDMPRDAKNKIDESTSSIASYTEFSHGIASIWHRDFKNPQLDCTITVAGSTLRPELPEVVQFPMQGNFEFAPPLALSIPPSAATPK